MNNGMLKRFVTGGAAIVFLVVIMLVQVQFFVLSLFLLSIIAQYEMSGCLEKAGYKTLPWVGYLWTLAIPIFAANRIYELGLNCGLLIIAVFLSLAIYFIYMLLNYPKFSIADLAVNIFGGGYVIFSFMCILMVRMMNHGETLVWILFLGAWMTDIFAYMVGSLFGKTKLLPNVSPNKSLEGAIGAVVGATVSVTLFGMFFCKEVVIDSVYIVLLGVMCGVFSQLGDWAMSAFKRMAGIKDFGKILPGHGGIIDRFDSIMFLAPIVFGVLTIAMM